MKFRQFAKLVVLWDEKKLWGAKDEYSEKWKQYQMGTTIK